ncbi:hypothetical protein Ancab_002270, partial [Ancistrocladus abbreviatus]
GSGVVIQDLDPSFYSLEVWAPEQGGRKNGAGWLRGCNSRNGPSLESKGEVA